MTHQQFLDKLWEKNEHYRNGDFWVLGEYVGSKTKVLLGTKYGECKLAPTELYKGVCPAIRSATNKTEFFKRRLRDKNTHFREGHFSIVSEYTGKDNYILAKNSYGICKVRPSALNKGANLSIKTAIDKSDYFRNMCLDRFGEEINDDLSQIYYINNTTKVKVIGDLGEYWIRPNDYYSGVRSREKGYIEASNKKRSSPEKLTHLLKKKNPSLEIVNLNNYKNNTSKILVRDSYGVVSCAACRLLSGETPSIKSAIDKTSYWVSQAKEVHGDKYDYSLVKYTDSDTKVKIICPDNGLFEQNPCKHLKGASYPKKSKSLWRDSSWDKAGKSSNNFDGFKVYFIECTDPKTGETFCKIGKTFKTIKSRFKNSAPSIMPYTYRVIATIEGTSGVEISKLERKYQELHKDYKYIPHKKFPGSEECFSKLIFV